MVGPSATPLLLLKAKNNNHYYPSHFFPKTNYSSSTLSKTKIIIFHINISFKVLACYPSTQKSFLYIFTSNLVDDLHHPLRFHCYSIHPSITASMIGLYFYIFLRIRTFKMAYQINYIYKEINS